MIFNTWIFGIYGLSVFTIYWRIIPPAWRPNFLALAGIVFYAWSIPAYTLLVFTLGVITYVTGWMLLRLPEYKRAKRRSVFAFGVLASVGALVFFKYTPLFADLFHLKGFPAIAVPLAISFFTFEFVHFLTDVYAGKITRLSVRDFTLFTLFFPTMVAGPIKRYEQFVPQIGNEYLDGNAFAAAIFRIALGYAKKAILADSMTPFVAPLLDAIPTANSGDYLIAILAYTAKIYFDFTGYSDIAIGVSALLGYTVPENFQKPYASTSIAEFWRRWHISLSSWIRDYLFIPLGGSRRSLGRTLANLSMVMGIAGLWHGAAWHFVVWGLWHGAGLGVHRVWSGIVNARPRISLAGSFARRSVATALTFSFVALGWVLFAAPNLHMAMNAYAKTFGL